MCIHHKGVNIFDIKSTLYSKMFLIRKVKVLWFQPILKAYGYFIEISLNWEYLNRNWTCLALYIIIFRLFSMKKKYLRNKKNWLRYEDFWLYFIEHWYCVHSTFNRTLASCKTNNTCILPESLLIRILNTYMSNELFILYFIKVCYM